MITEGVSYRFGNHWRACAAPVSRALLGWWQARVVAAFRVAAAVLCTREAHF